MSLGSAWGAGNVSSLSIAAAVPKCGQCPPSGGSVGRRSGNAILGGGLLGVPPPPCEGGLPKTSTARSVVEPCAVAAVGRAILAPCPASPGCHTRPGTDNNGWVALHAMGCTLRACSGCVAAGLDAHCQGPGQRALKKPPKEAVAARVAPSMRALCAPE